MNNPYFEYLNSIERDKIPEPVEVEYIVINPPVKEEEILTPKREYRNKRGEVVLIY